MSLPSFPTGWTAPSECFATTNYYRVLLGSGFFSNMYGTPTPVLTGNYPTGSCFPPSSTPEIPYLTDGPCPAGYTRACATAGPVSNGKPLSTVTCCPSVTDNVFSFMCKDNQYGCHATATSGAVWTGVVTDIGRSPPTENPVTRTPSTLEGIEAWGIKLISIVPASTSSSSSPPSTPNTASTGTTAGAGQGGQNTNSAVPVAETSGGLGIGAIVGIVVGVIALLALVALGVFFYLRKRRKAEQNYELAANSPGTVAGAPYVVPKPPGEVPKPGDGTYFGPGGYQNGPMSELDTGNHAHQLDAGADEPYLASGAHDSRPGGRSELYGS
ncbi:hypothetical protein B0H63DRAFT_527135 [Podospora didyma]|uniref:Mid2 domain-containing protein n=1 Tax=Podospora didyma TaxID=330526 RepID=A0AAE0N7G8_9PEZI|nr:hypothetical protein B0H63DRAFT_527135 [Podospora didyma]